MPKPRRRQPKKQAPRRAVPPRRERTKRGRTRSKKQPVKPEPVKQEPVEQEQAEQRQAEPEPAASPASTLTPRRLRGEALGLTEAPEALTWMVFRRRGRPPGGTLALEEHLRRYPDGTMEDDKPLTVKSRLRKLFDEQGIVVNERTVRRWLAAARRR